MLSCPSKKKSSSYMTMAPFISAITVWWVDTSYWFWYFNFAEITLSPSLSDEEHSHWDTVNDGDWCGYESSNCRTLPLFKSLHRTPLAFDPPDQIIYGGFQDSISFRLLKDACDMADSRQTSLEMARDCANLLRTWHVPKSTKTILLPFFFYINRRCPVGIYPPN